MIPFVALLLWFLRHEVESLEFKVYLSLILGYLGIFSLEESHQYVLATERTLVFAGDGLKCEVVFLLKWPHIKQPQLLLFYVRIPNSVLWRGHIVNDR